MFFVLFFHLRMDKRSAGNVAERESKIVKGEQHGKWVDENKKIVEVSWMNVARV